MRWAGQICMDLLAEMIEDRKKRRSEEDARKWSSRKKKDYVSLSEIKDWHFPLMCMQESDVTLPMCQTKNPATSVYSSLRLVLNYEREFRMQSKTQIYPDCAESTGIPFRTFLKNSEFWSRYSSMVRVKISKGIRYFRIVFSSASFVRRVLAIISIPLKSSDITAISISLPADMAPVLDDPNRTRS